MHNRPDIEKNPIKYEILGPADSKDKILSTPTEVYKKDPEPYYMPTKRAEVDETPILTPKEKVYGKDRAAYYNPIPEVTLINVPSLGKQVPVEFKDLTESFPSDKNLAILKDRLNALLNSSNQSARNKVYFDPTALDGLDEIGSLKKKIQEMEDDLNSKIKAQVTIELEKKMQKIEVQNNQNSNAELVDKFIKNNFYKSKTPKPAQPKEKTPDDTKKEYIDAEDKSDDSSLVEADEIPSRLSSNFVSTSADRKSNEPKESKQITVKK